MKVAVAQINPTIGDIEGNAEKIVQNANKAKEMGSDLVIFPEMALTGYPPTDLLLRASFVERAVAALSDIGRRTTSIPCIVGFVDKNPLPEGKPLYNAAAIIEEGQIQYITYKSHLPRYDHFDQSRYFEPAVGISPTKFKDKRIAITIGEDLWDDQSSGLSMGFPKALLGDIQKKKVELVINLIASPYAVGLDQKRVEILKKQATTFKVPIVMCNQVGGNDELVFDGSSVGVSAAGEVIARGKAFQEDLIFIDLVYGAGDIHEEDRSTNDLVYRAVVQGIRDFAQKCGYTKAAFLLSPSLDSAVVAAASAEALGKDNVIAVAISNDAEARQVASTLGIKVENPDSTLAGLLGKGEADLQARLQAAVLVGMAGKFQALPLSTVNRSDLYLNGDGGVGLAPLGDIPRSMLQAVAQEVINRERGVIPASMLKGDASADPVIQQFIDGADLPTDAVSQKIEATEFKRRQRPMTLKVCSNLLRPARQLPIARKR
jgi:predicted amidohydrolase